MQRFNPTPIPNARARRSMAAELRRSAASRGREPYRNLWPWRGGRCAPDAFRRPSGSGRSRCRTSWTSRSNADVYVWLIPLISRERIGKCRTDRPFRASFGFGIGISLASFRNDCNLLRYRSLDNFEMRTLAPTYALGSLQTIRRVMLLLNIPF